jgi:thiamine-monophosphate kinase
MLDSSGVYKVNLVGGDLSKSERLIVDVSMLGMVEKNNLVLRNGAKKGDIIFVTGKLGGSIQGKHLKFTPRIKEARFLVKNFKLNSMIDISDGLAQDLGHILKESKQGAAIYEELIPQDKKARSLNDALYMGEDFELLFTMSHSDAGRLLARNHLDYKPIGEIMEKKYGLRLVDKKGKERIIKPCGFRHF